MKKVKLAGNNNKFALVDAIDYDKVIKAGPWYLIPLKNNNYAFSPKVGYMHRFLLDLKSKLDIGHHVNHKGLDNRRTNLHHSNFLENNQIRNRRDSK